jgi:putative oxidoreductase
MYANTFTIFAIYSAQAIFVLRVVLGILFVVHGWPKIKNLRETQANFGAMGFKPGVLWGTIAAVLEFFGGLAIVFGILTQAAALFIAAEMLVAVGWKIKKGQGFVGGYELDLVLFVAALALAALGGGAYALDFLI